MLKAGYIDPGCVLIVLVLAGVPGTAMAYIDPGSGAYMVQAMFAVVAAALFYARHPIRTLKAIWRWILGRSENNSLPQSGEFADPDIHVPPKSQQSKISSGEP